MVVEISLRLKHECPYLDFSTHFGRKTIYHYCNSVNDYMIIPERLSKEKQDLAISLFGSFNNFFIKPIDSPFVMTYIFMDCPSNKLYQSMINLKGVPIFPIKYKDGFENWTVYFQTEFTASNFVTEMKNKIEMEILSKENLDERWMFSQNAVLDQLINGLTEHQINVLIQAFEGGYYNIPRDIGASEIALKNGISRYAVDKTLRSAESKIFNYIMPFIYHQRSHLGFKQDLPEKLPFKISDHSILK